MILINNNEIINEKNDKAYIKFSLDLENINKTNIEYNITENEELGINNIVEITDIKDNDLKFILKDNEVNNILSENFSNIQNNIIDLSIIEPNNNLDEYYTHDNLMSIFNKCHESIMIIEIYDGKISYIEKKGYESRNQSVIDLLIKTNNYKKLPDIQFLVFTNDFIQDEQIYKFPYIYTFCKKYNYNTKLFPNFNFNHWLEAGIDEYENVYKHFTNNNVEWNNKKDLIFWSGAKTNSIRKKLHKSSVGNSKFFINIIDDKKTNYIHLYEISKYKFLLNMNGNSYGGRLNYLFLSGSCVIILKNKDKENVYDEFFYHNFIPNEDYIEILYNDNEDGNIILNKILETTKNINAEEMAKKCYEKACKIFDLNNIYDYIHTSLTDLTNFYKKDENKKININTFYIPPLNYIYKNRLKINNPNQLEFLYYGNDTDIILHDTDTENKIILNLGNEHSKILFNEKIILDKYTPMIINPNKSQKYIIEIKNNILNLMIDINNNKFKLLHCEIPFNNFLIKNIDIKTKNGGWWMQH